MPASILGSNGNAAAPVNGVDRVVAPTRSNGSPWSDERPLIKEVPPRLYGLGFLALAGWLLLFSAGLLIETVEYRFLLSPRTVALQLGREGVKSLPGPMRARAEEILVVERTGDPVPAKVDAAAPTATFWTYLHAFVVSLLCFTPLNLAILTLFAGLAGGCASNIMLISLPAKNLKRLRKENPHRYFFLQEPPVSAAIRGFVVFMCIIAGLYIAIEDPFKDPTPAQYIRMAGLLSIMAFMVGYDPSRLDDWLRLVPTPGKTTADKGADEDKGQRKISTVEAKVSEDGAIKTTVVVDEPPAEPPAVPETQADAAQKEAAAEQATT